MLVKRDVLQMVFVLDGGRVETGVIGTLAGGGGGGGGGADGLIYDVGSSTTFLSKIFG